MTPSLSDPAMQLGARLADQALLLYGAGLLSVLLLAGGGWLLLRRVVKPLEPGVPLPPLQLVLRLGLALLGIVATAAAFAEMAEAIGPGDSLGRFDEAVAARLAQTLSPAALQVFSLLTHLGDVITLTAVSIATVVWLLWQGRRRMALAFALATAGGGLLNRLLKVTFERVRPLHDHGYAVVAEGYSFPSGHSAGAAVVYGMLAFVLLRTTPRQWHAPLVAAAAALVFTIGFSRVMLQVHWVSDVAAGLASGTAWLLTCVLIIDWLRRPRRT
ncbi:phosphatase PAP2 family protein [Aquincola tertiaricarbonis]|uniref:Phosphatase PAP2 family protein n=1 Tax=Aquincola tertiaricarbonis TaxID=391953 RepID=A0ABY4SEK4_AQUTE|nr:phosphatase PAP2 family protein [Aquincola tertiaricarbonis]URI10899.1 phosphatase PAP2 family protein [Aquincola tertiaricarbonis]